jgi:L-arabinonolactonase
VEQQRLYFVDSMDGRVFRCTAEGAVLRVWDVPGKIGSMAVRKDGEGAIVSHDAGFFMLDFKTSDCTLIHDPEPGMTTNRINDGKTDRRGRFFAGTMDTMEGPNGALYRIDPDMTVTKLEEGIICSNDPAPAPTTGLSTSPIPGPARSGPTTSKSRRARSPVAGDLGVTGLSEPRFGG